MHHQMKNTLQTSDTFVESAQDAFDAAPPSLTQTIEQPKAKTTRRKLPGGQIVSIIMAVLMLFGFIGLLGE